jgi:hypothetical protein
VARREDLIDALNRRAAFPRHGTLIDREGHTHLVFPVEQATSSVLVPRRDAPPSLAGTGWLRVAAFRQTLFKVLVILDELAAHERAILMAPPLDDGPPEIWTEAIAAQQRMGLSVEIFFIFFRMLADRLALALSYVVLDEPTSGWTDYPRLLKSAASADRRLVLPDDEAAAFYAAVLEHRGWFELLRKPGGGGKGIRDAILHRPIATQLSMEVADTGETTRLTMTLMSASNDVPTIDVFAAVSEVVGGLSRLLSALPCALWSRRAFILRDLTVTYPKPTPHGLQYFPVLADLRDPQT